MILPSQTLHVSAEVQTSLAMLYAYNLTMFNSVDEFGPYRTLSRQEAAKFFVEFAMNVLCRIPNQDEIIYTDVENADPTLTPFIQRAYQL